MTLFDWLDLSDIPDATDYRNRLGWIGRQIESYQEQGGTFATDLRDALRDAGASFSNTLYSKLWQLSTQNLVDSSRVQLLRNRDLVTEDLLPRMLYTGNVTGKYQFVFSYLGIDENTGMPSQQSFTLLTDNLSTKGELVNSVSEILRYHYGLFNLNSANVKLIRGFRPENQ